MINVGEKDATIFETSQQFKSAMVQHQTLNHKK
jgi:hypothetical protein